MQMRCRTALSSSMAAKPLSVTATICRSGSQRATCSMTCRPQSVSFLCRRLCLRAYRSDGARTVKNGSAQMRPAQVISGRSIIESHRRPLALTK